MGVLQTNEKRQAIGLENLLVSVLIHTWRFFFRWNTIDLALTFRSLMSTLLPHSTIGIFSHTRTKSRCQLGIFVSNTGGNIKHDNGTLTLNVVAISQSAKFLLTSSVPYIEPDCSSVSVENQWMDFNTKGGNIFLLKFTCQMAFDEGCLASATVTDKNKFESGHISIRSHISNFRLGR